jgi:hypothetical protein
MKGRQMRRLARRSLPRRTTAAATAVVAAAGAIAQLALGAGGLSISPAIVEHAATPGPVGAVTVTNTSDAPLKVTVVARPWAQSSAGAVTPNERASLASQIALSAGAFSLAAGHSQVVNVSLRAKPANGSLYGNIEVLALPTTPPTQTGVSIGYRLIDSLRLDPAVPRLKVTVGRVIVHGGRAGVALVAVHNNGNTIDPIGGTARTAGPGRKLSAKISPVRILPGATVDLVVARLSGQRAGKHTATLRLTQRGKVVATTSRAFTLR